MTVLSKQEPGYYSESEDSEYDQSDEDVVSVDDWDDEERDYEKEDDFLVNSDKILKPAPQKIGEFDTVSPGETVKNYEFQEETIDVGKKSEMEYFRMFFTPEIVDHIVKCTNLELSKRRNSSKNKDNDYRQKVYKNTNPEEFLGFLGLWIKLGAGKFKGLSIDDIFSTKKDVCSLDAHLVLSRDRYKGLFSCLRFDRKDQRRKIKVGDGMVYEDKAVHIRWVWNELFKRSQESYQPGQFVTIDELLLFFKGRCRFRSFIPSKKAKHGIKIWAAADPTTMYCMNADIYTGKQPKEKGDDSLEGEKVVMKLAGYLTKKGRVFVADNFFISRRLGKRLWVDRTHLLGTIRKSSKGMPDAIKKEGMKEGECYFLYNQQETLMKLQVRKKKETYLYSTYHHKPTVNAASKKPSIINTYNKTKFGIDLLDKMAKHFSFFPKTNRWPVRIFTWLVDVMAINSLVLYKMFHAVEEEVTNEGFRKTFLRRLGDQLMEAQMKARAAEPHHHWTYTAFKEIYDAIEALHEKVMGRKSGTENDRECKICSENVNPILMAECEVCNDKVCRKHVHGICDHCLEAPQEVPGPSTSGKSAPFKRCHSCGTHSARKCYKTTCDRYLCKKHRKNAEDGSIYCEECASKNRKKFL